MRIKTLSENKKAFFDYEILESYEAGISLLGQEVKSLKHRGVNLAGTFVFIKGEEAFWVGANISPWQPKNIGGNFNPKRDRKLLLKKSEIKHLLGKTRKTGLVLIPLKVYLKGKFIKMEIGLAKKRKKVSKKEMIKKREIEREMQREAKEFRGKI